jgi:hypothetical protein
MGRRIRVTNSSQIVRVYRQGAREYIEAIRDAGREPTIDEVMSALLAIDGRMLENVHALTWPGVIAEVRRAAEEELASPAGEARPPI